MTRLTLSVLRRGLGGEVAVTTSGCLGPCFEGPNVVVYPDGVWYAGIGSGGDVDGDVEAIVDHLAGGPVVERLLRPDEDEDDDGGGGDDGG